MGQVDLMRLRLFVMFKFGMVWNFKHVLPYFETPTLYEKMNE